MKTQEDPRIAVGEQQGNTRNIIFQLQKKKMQALYYFFCCGVQSAPTKVPTATAAAGRPTAGGGEWGG